jgi:hypothetical protein
MVGNFSAKSEDEIDKLNFTAVYLRQDNREQ